MKLAKTKTSLRAQVNLPGEGTPWFMEIFRTDRADMTEADHATASMLVMSMTNDMQHSDHPIYAEHGLWLGNSYPIVEG